MKTQTINEEQLRRVVRRVISEAMFSPALSAKEWGEVLRGSVDEFLYNINSDTELLQYLRQSGSDFPGVLSDVVSRAKELRTALEELASVRP